MTKQLKGSLYYLLANSRYSLIVFWSVLGAVLLLTLVVDFLTSDSSTFAFNLSFPIYVFAAVMGYWIVKNTIPYIIKLGGTRKNIFSAIGMYAIILTLFNAIIANVVSSLITFVYGQGKFRGVISLSYNDNIASFNHIGDFLENSTWLTKIFIDMSISFFLLAMMLMIGLIFYRYGLIGGFSFLAIGMITFIIGMTKGWLSDFFIQVFSNFSFVFFYQLFFVGVGIYVLSYLLLRRLTIVTR